MIGRLKYLPRGISARPGMSEADVRAALYGQTRTSTAHREDMGRISDDALARALARERAREQQPGPDLEIRRNRRRPSRARIRWTRVR